MLSILIVAIAGFAIWVSFGFVDKDNAKDVSEIQKVITKGVDKFHNVDVLPAPHNSSLDKIPDDV